MRAVFACAASMYLCPDLPGSTDITITWSSVGANRAAHPGRSVPGLTASPTPTRAALSRSCTSPNASSPPHASAWTVTMSLPASAWRAASRTGSETIKCVSNGSSVRARSSATFSAPNVVAGTNLPSITSMCIMSALPSSQRRTSPGRSPMSPAVIDGHTENWQPSSASMTGATSASAALPCHFGLSSMCSTPLPFIVLAMIIVGEPLWAAARRSAESSCSMRWPSTSMTFHPNARHLSAVRHLDGSLHIADGPSPSPSRRSSGITSSVYESCWMKLRSSMAVRLSTAYFEAAIAASHTCPSSVSPSPRTVYTRDGRPSSRAARAAPIEYDRPMPSEPPQNSTPGHFRSGWPCRRLPRLRSVSISDSSK